MTGLELAVAGLSIGLGALGMALTWWYGRRSQPQTCPETPPTKTTEPNAVDTPRRQRPSNGHVKLMNSKQKEALRPSSGRWVR